NDLDAKHLNNLFWTYGRDHFVSKILNHLQTSQSFGFNDTDRLLIAIKDQEIQRYIEKCEKTLTVMNVGRYNIGVVFGEQHVNDVCHALHKKYPELDLIAMVNMLSRKISYRTEVEFVDVSKFAQYFGGGGRQATAGSEINEETIKRILRSDIFSN